MHGWAIQSPTTSRISHNGVSFIDGYENLSSPQMSSSVDSLGNGGFFCSQYCSAREEWVHSSDSEGLRCGEHVGSLEYHRESPFHQPLNLVSLSGSWPQNGQMGNECAFTEIATQSPQNGYCNSWKGGDFNDYQVRNMVFQRSISCKSDDDSWIGHGKESLTGSPYPKKSTCNELHLRIDQCYEQLRCLEKERRMVSTNVQQYCFAGNWFLERHLRSIEAVQVAVVDLVVIDKIWNPIITKLNV